MASCRFATPKMSTESAVSATSVQAIFKFTAIKKKSETARVSKITNTYFFDNLRETKTAAQTQLNAFEWKHAVYFNRIKETVARIWSPILQMRRYDPAGALIGRSEKTTLVEITLDLSGAVIGAEIKSPSGVFYLDDEAIHAFKTAAQFPNPPKALFAEKDNFSFTFGFVVSLQKGFSMSFD